MEKQKKLKIAIFHLGFFFSGGGEKLVLQEAAGLQKQGHDVDVYAPVVDKQKCFPDLLKKIAIRRLFLPLPAILPLRDFISISGAVLLTPLTFWRFCKYDAFTGANQPGPLICYLLSKILQKPYIIYLAQPTRIIYPRQIDKQVGFGKGSFDVFYLLARIFRQLIKRIDYISIVSANKILVNGEYVKKMIAQTYGVEPIVCAAGVDILQKKKSVDRFSGKIIVNQKCITKPYLLITNRHFPQKRFDYLISSLPFILKKAPQITLVITGATTYYTAYLKRLVAQLGLDDVVIFTNLVEEKSLQRLYENAAVYVYTAPEEDFGMGVVEAMANGVPVVAWNWGGPATTIQSGITGYLAERDDLADFTNKIITLLEDKKKNQQMAKKAQKHVYNFNFRRHLAILEQALLNVVVR